MSQITSKFIQFDTSAVGTNGQVIPADYPSPVNFTPVQVASEGTDKISAYFKGIDNALSTSVVATGISGTNWLSNLTFNYSTAFGTPAFSQVYYRRVGDSMEVRGIFQSGTVTGATAYIQLPSGFAIDYSKLPPTGGSINIGYSLGTEGAAVFSVGNGKALFLDGSTPDQIFFGVNGTGGPSYGYIAAVGSSTFNTGENIPFYFSIPIVGWTVSNGSVINQTYPIRTITTATTLLASDNYVLVNGSGAVTVTLPAPVIGQLYNIKNITTNLVTIISTSGTIDGSSSATLPVQDTSLGLITDGTNWFVV